MRPLTTAIGNYGVTRAIKDGRIKPDGLALEQIAIDPITKAMRRMVRGLEFDVCEMAFTTYLCAKALGKPIIALPIFVTRNFHHGAASCHVKSGIAKPTDLEGRTVAVNRGYTVTTGTWIRGILKSEYGVDLAKVTWSCTDEEHVAEYRAPGNANYALHGKSAVELLVAGAVEATVGDVRTDSPDVRPLIPDAREAGFAYFRKTGIYPLNHTVVIKSAIVDAEPAVADSLFRLFKASKETYLAELASGTAPTPADQMALALQAVVGDPFPVGVAANRKAVETLVDFAVDQQVIPRKLSVESLFAPSTLALG